MIKIKLNFVRAAMLVCVLGCNDKFRPPDNEHRLERIPKFQQENVLLEDLRRENVSRLDELPGFDRYNCDKKRTIKVNQGEARFITPNRKAN